MKKILTSLALFLASYGMAQAAASFPMDGVYWNPLNPSTYWLVIANGATPSVPPGVATATSSVLIVMMAQSGTTQTWSYGVNTGAPVNTVVGTPMKMVTSSCIISYNAVFDTVSGMTMAATPTAGTVASGGVTASTACTAVASSIGTPTLLKIF